MNLEIKEIIYGTDEYERSIDVRDVVFRRPVGLNIRTNDDLTKDKECEMYGGYVDEIMVSTIFLSEFDKDTAQIKAVTVLEEFRGTGLGNKLMEFIENLAREKGYTKSFLQSRVTAVGFYERFGYKTIGEPFIMNKIPHIDMVKNF